MSKYHGDDTVASNPGGLTLSESRLRALEPELLVDGDASSPGEATGSTVHRQQHEPIGRLPARRSNLEERERLEEHLALGNCEPAVVVSVNPLVIAAYSSDLDAAILLKFSIRLVAEHGLRIGSKLLAVNTYISFTSTSNGETLYAVDIIPGPRRSGWSNAVPLIADFMSDDLAAIGERLSDIAPDRWRRLDEVTAVRLSRSSLDTARDGRPTRAGIPNLMAEPVPYTPMRFHKLAKGASAIRRWAIAVVELLLGILMFLVLWDLIN